MIPSIAHAHNQKVLVLHSYHQGLEWTDNITKGIRSILDLEGDDVEIYFEYLDTKRNSSQSYTKMLLDLFRAKENQVPFDLIITSDNNALEFVREYGRELYPDVPVVFCGVNFFHQGLISGLNQVTGVVEVADVKATMDMMLELHPKSRKILVVMDQTPTGLSIRKTVESVEGLYKGRAELEYYTDFTWQSLEKKISMLGDEYLIYLLTLNRDKENVFMSYLDGIDIVNRVATVPVYGSWDFYLGKGILGGVITTGFYQGELAAKMGARILAGESAKDIPVERDQSNQTIFDYNVMKRYGVKKSSLPSNAILINEPPSILEQIRAIPNWLILVLIAFFASLTSLLITLRIRQKLTLRANADLDHKVRVKTTELNESNNKLSNLIGELENANQKLHQIAISDPLTGIFNRRYVSSRLTEEHGNAERYSTPLSLLMLDIDFFKQLNDNYGHQYGDVALRRISQSILGLIREGDIFGRYGGEEFLLVLPHTSSQQAFQLAERIRHEIASLKWDEANLTVTISGGVAEYTGQSESELLRQADNCLYRAKASGRNCIK